MSDQNELLAVCADLIRLIEGVGCKDWRDQYGQRIKDTNEWVRAYVAINKAISDTRNEQKAQPPCGAGGAVPADVVARFSSFIAEIAESEGWEYGDDRDALASMSKDAADVLRLLASQPAAPVAQAVPDIRCETCKHDKVHHRAEPCASCIREIVRGNSCPRWEAQNAAQGATTDGGGKCP